MPTSTELTERDLRVVWHPCTQMKYHVWLPMIPIARGEGVWLHGHDGPRYLDALVATARSGIEATTCD